MKPRFRLTPEARADLREILLGIATESPDAAERLRSEFYEALQHHQELLDVRYRFWNFYSYVVCYLWRKKPMQIIAVVHGARDLAAFLATRSHKDS